MIYIPLYCPTHDCDAHAEEVGAWIKTKDGYRQRLRCSECREWHWITHVEAEYAHS
jgi:hypothetical protein